MAHSLSNDSAISSSSKTRITLTVNGQPRSFTFNRNEERTKKGCDHGQCGTCTVTVNGTRINSCLTFASLENVAEVSNYASPVLQGALEIQKRNFFSRLI